MCLECEPENDHGCCRLQMTLARRHAQATVPKIYARRVGMRHYDTLYAVWLSIRLRWTYISTIWK
jgi:hypothetical protein